MAARAKPPVLRGARILLLLACFLTIGMIIRHSFGWGCGEWRGDKEYAALIPPVDNKTDVHVQLAIVTAFSQNHKLEAIAMIRTLVAVEFTGDVYIYLMRRVGENPSWGDAVKDELSKSPLSLIFIDLEVTEEYSKYCFKPRAMANFYHRQFLLPEEDRVHVVMVSKLIYLIYLNEAMQPRSMSLTLYLCPSGRIAHPDYYKILYSGQEI